MSQQKKPLQIQQDDKFFSRLLSKESSMANPSSRVLYYADHPGWVPFLWESQPGTPKTATFRSHGDELYPPLTPPPPYYSKHNKFTEKTDHHHRHKCSRSSSLLSFLFPKRLGNIIGLKDNVIKPGKRISSSAMLDHSATFRSRSATTTTWFSSSSSSFNSRGEEEEDDDDDKVIDDYNNNNVSPNSTLCFRCYRG